ncbi:DUF6058 family natural product biosynthesis protein [Klebsiella spallanzanii]|uniref:DUF6058 family natural product biosynthesis protein n=1 Tax=Klebsiella spallanzanii TaxID=2587528 RepID=UPI001159A876|nr:DUF6058 family natural product biosynthesis protein [Klebsiella spallanzanii]VUS90870.1 hypothetical protein SB6419_04823 [Klebsiella spallanzanii]
MIEKYLKEFFVSEDKFVEEGGITAETLSIWQASRIFPMPSYVTETESVINSFFGTHRYVEMVKWYPNQLDAWTRLIRSFDFSKGSVEVYFKKRYMNKIIELKSIGIYDSIYDDCGSREVILQEVWQHFLDGTYGVCTKNCTPEQIATKDVATNVINKLTDRQKKITIAEKNKPKLAIALNLLDSVTSFFAPHERNQCSRTQCIDTVRKKYLHE